MAFDLKIKANSVSYRMLSSFQATTRTTTIIVKHSNKLLLIFSSLYCLKQPQTSLLIFDFELKKNNNIVSLLEDIEVVYGGAPSSGSSCSTIHQFFNFLFTAINSLYPPLSNPCDICIPAHPHLSIHLFSPCLVFLREREEKRGGAAELEIVVKYMQEQLCSNVHRVLLVKMVRTHQQPVCCCRSFLQQL